MNNFYVFMVPLTDTLFHFIRSYCGPQSFFYSMSLLLIDRFWNSSTLQTTLLQIPPKTTEAVSKDAVGLSYNTNSCSSSSPDKSSIFYIGDATRTVLMKDHRSLIGSDFRNRILSLLHRYTFQPITTEHLCYYIYPENEFSVDYLASGKSASTFPSVHCNAQPSTSCYRFRRLSFHKSTFCLEGIISPGRRLPRTTLFY